MAIGQHKDVEQGEINSLEDLKTPLIHDEDHHKVVVTIKNDDTNNSDQENGTMKMVLLSTFVAVCGSFEFGSCVSSLSSHLHYLLRFFFCKFVSFKLQDVKNWNLCS